MGLAAGKTEQVMRHLRIHITCRNLPAPNTKKTDQIELLQIKSAFGVFEVTTFIFTGLWP